MYQYACRVVRVVDADTVDLELDLGFTIRRTDRFRLYGPDPDAADGLNAPEPNEPGGVEARDFLTTLLAGLTGLTVRTVKAREKFGRYLAVLTGTDAAGGPVNVNAALVAAGHAALKSY